MNELFEKMKMHPFLAALTCTVAFYGILFAFFTPIYETNDDVFMTFIANGYYLGKPDSHIFLSNIVLGKILVYLYTVYSGINWYATIDYVIGFLSLYTALFIAFSQAKHRIVLIEFLTFIVTFYFRFLLFLQYTTLSAVVSISGFFLFFYVIENLHINKRNFLYALSGFLIIAGSIIRIHSFFMVGLLLSPLFIIRAVEIFKKGIHRSIYVFIIFTITIFALTQYINYQTYSYTSAWKNFISYYKSESNFHEYALYSYSDNKNVFEKIGWSKNDYAVFINWLHYSDTVFSQKKIQAAIDSILFKNIHRQLIRTMSYFLETISTFSIYIMLVLSLFFTYKKFISQKNKTVVYSIVCIALAICLYCSYVRWLPPRVFIPIIVCLGFSLLFFLNSSEKSFQANSYRKISVSVFFVCCFILLFYLAFFENNLNKKRIDIHRNLVSQLPQHAFIVENGFKYEWVPVFENTLSFGNTYVLFGGWTVHSPGYQQILKAHHIKDIYQALYEKNDVFFVSQPSIIKLLQIFVENHYGIKTRVMKIRTYKDNVLNLNLYKLQRL